MSTSSLSSLLSLPKQLLGGGATSSATSAGQSSSSGMSGLFGSFMGLAKAIAPKLISAIPYVGPFASMLMQAGPMLGALTNKNAAKTGQGGATDAATSAAIAQLMQQQRGSSAINASDDKLNSALSPNLRIPGSGTENAAIQMVYAQIGQQPTGQKLLKALAGRDLTVEVVDDATYAKLVKQGKDQPHVLTIPQSALADPQKLTKAMVDGLAVEVEGMATSPT